MDQFTNDVTFVFKHNINNFDELDTYQSNIEKTKENLLKERQRIYKQIKRCRNSQYKEMFEYDKNTVNVQIELINEEIKNCNGLRERMKDKINKIELVKQIENEEKYKARINEEKSK